MRDMRSTTKVPVDPEVKAMFKLCKEKRVIELGSFLRAKGPSVASLINKPERPQGDGNTVLHIAAILDSLRLAELLLAYGANPSSKNARLETPAHSAARAGNLAILKFLVKRGSLNGILDDVRMARGSVGDLRSNTKSESRSRNQVSPSSVNILHTACESKSTDCVKFLIDEIMSARKSLIHDEDEEESESPKGGPKMFDSSHAIDMREFLTIPVPHDVIFFELGYDLASSNAVCTVQQLEQTTYAKMLAHTPGAVMHLLNKCVYSKDRTTFVDFFPFFNPKGNSEINLLRTIVHYKRFDLLTHPVCELFLHLKWLRAKGLYWFMIILYLFFTLQILTYSIFNYGELGQYFTTPMRPEPNNTCHVPNEPWLSIDNNLHCRLPGVLKWSVFGTSMIMILIFLAKIYQDKENLFQWRWWQYRPEDLLPMAVIVLFLVDAFDETMTIGSHKVLCAILAWGSCRIMMHTIARDPDIAIFVEMVSQIQISLLKFFVSYIWLFVGWIIVFHILLGNSTESSFHDIGSATAKVLAMFSGEIGFETSFRDDYTTIQRMTIPRLTKWRPDFHILMIQRLFFLKKKAKIFFLPLTGFT